MEPGVAVRGSSPHQRFPHELRYASEGGRSAEGLTDITDHCKDATKEDGIASYLTCINNEHYPASLELGKTYEVLEDEAAPPDMLRVIDESGEDHLYPARNFFYFYPIDYLLVEKREDERLTRAYNEAYDGEMEEEEEEMLRRVKEYHRRRLSAGSSDEFIRDKRQEAELEDQHG